ncbi:hypothetical protein GGI03_000792 [Coemansia sp. RSA 2337]|nr:hypothetical protein GGI03_000792 [Coemansia sp. RSA 2337]
MYGTTIATTGIAMLNWLAAPEDDDDERDGLSSSSSMSKSGILSTSIILGMLEGLLDGLLELFLELLLVAEDLVDNLLDCFESLLVLLPDIDVSVDKVLDGLELVVEVLVGVGTGAFVGGFGGWSADLVKSAEFMHRLFWHIVPSGQFERNVQRAWSQIISEVSLAHISWPSEFAQTGSIRSGTPARISLSVEASTTDICCTPTSAAARETTVV